MEDGKVIPFPPGGRDGFDPLPELDDLDFVEVPE